MRKAELMEYFGGTQVKVAAAIGRTQTRVSAWTEPLPFEVQVDACLLSKYRLVPDDAALLKLARYAEVWRNLRKRGVSVPASQREETEDVEA